MGSFLAARHSGRFSSDEASQRSQCLAKLRISDKRLMENFHTLHGSLVDSAQSSTLQVGRESHALVSTPKHEMKMANASSGISSIFTTSEEADLHLIYMVVLYLKMCHKG